MVRPNVCRRQGPGVGTDLFAPDHHTRELFLPDATKGKEQMALHMLHGMNEIHHTIENWLGHYVNDATKAFPVETLAQQLSQIAAHYHLERWLTSAVERARKANFAANSPPKTNE